MSAPAGLTRVIIRRGNEKHFVDLTAPAVQVTSLAELGEAIRKAVEAGAFGPPPAKKPKAEKPTAPPTE